ncbi:MAG: DUF1624 domain-containing protein [Clostridia bacterium]|nr:DUF1624 domain-containing protein [Clostridia bacterium]
MQGRIRLLDMLRGGAVIAMVLYHTVYTFGAIFRLSVFTAMYAALKFIAPPIIATTFILISAYASSLSRKNVRRGALIFAVAMGLTVATCRIMPLLGINGAGIRFGILHFLGIAIMLSPVLCKLARRLPPVPGIAVCILLAVGTRNPVKNGFFGLPVTDPIQSVNLLFPLGIYHPPFSSADYYPLLPWLFVFMIGCFIAVMLPKARLPRVCYKKICPPIEWIGRHSLLIYVIHQPVIFCFGELWRLFKTY